MEENSTSPFVINKLNVYCVNIQLSSRNLYSTFIGHSVKFIITNVIGQLNRIFSRSWCGVNASFLCEYLRFLIHHKSSATFSISRFQKMSFECYRWFKQLND
ncbi:Chitobiosyldiphosphodolichol beta-mannosyltransferase [Daphnia magna]|uniref:Chitobiosyldiphosphodolichol beta-mannosyltransferase n=1 Tax=Daphnia magna TaxID=35525 RepID=A0A164ITH9_9CRUS|nr:Chitobiosyldiphosphodolichol beta-mannosyltransferase [Daphnia magna]